MNDSNTRKRQNTITVAKGRNGRYSYVALLIFEYFPEQTGTLKPQIRLYYRGTSILAH